jgi:hypothetical protein
MPAGYQQIAGIQRLRDQSAGGIYALSEAGQSSHKRLASCD